MNVARPLRIIAIIAAVVAIALGMGTYTHPGFITIHMLFGLLVALILLTLAVMAVFTSGLRRMGVIGILYALLVPIFGVTQEMILPGDLHWLIETAHLAVGFGALTFIGAIGTAFVRRQQASSKPVTAPADVPQAIR